MHQIPLTDETYKRAQRGAQVERLKSVEAFVAHAVAQRLNEDDAPTPAWMLAEIGKGGADAEAGRTLTFDQYQIKMREHRAQWLKEHDWASY